jgi:hypothetical protein
MDIPDHEAKLNELADAMQKAAIALLSKAKDSSTGHVAHQLAATALRARNDALEATSKRVSAERHAAIIAKAGAR